MLYPNPNKGVFTVQWSEALTIAATLRITSSSGVVVYNSCSTTGSVQVNIHNQPAGTYYIEVQSGKEALHTSFIKE